MCTAEAYLEQLLTNAVIQNEIISQRNQLESILSSKNCQVGRKVSLYSEIFNYRTLQLADICLEM